MADVYRSPESSIFEDPVLSPTSNFLTFGSSPLAVNGSCSLNGESSGSEVSVHDDQKEDESALKSDLDDRHNEADDHLIKQFCRLKSPVKMVQEVQSDQDKSYESMRLCEVANDKSDMDHIEQLENDLKNALLELTEGVSTTNPSSPNPSTANPSLPNSNSPSRLSPGKSSSPSCLSPGLDNSTGLNTFPSPTDSTDRPRRKRPPSLKLIESVAVAPSQEEFNNFVSQKLPTSTQDCLSMIKTEQFFRNPPPATSPVPDVGHLSIDVKIPPIILPPSRPEDYSPEPKTGASISIRKCVSVSEFQSTPSIKDGETEDWPLLGEGWKKKEVMRRNGASAGRYDVYYLSPLGVKVRSKPELQTLLGDSLDLTYFNFRIGNFLESPGGRPTPKRKKTTKPMKTASSLAQIITETILSSTNPGIPAVSPKTEVLSPAKLPEMSLTKQAPDVIRTVRCKECENCKRNNCGECVYCRDMVKFGGRNSMRRSCALRKCTQWDNQEHFLKEMGTFTHPHPASTAKKRGGPAPDSSIVPGTTHIPNCTLDDKSVYGFIRKERPVKYLEPTLIVLDPLHCQKREVTLGYRVKRPHDSVASPNKKKRKMHPNQSIAQITMAALQKYIDCSKIPNEYNLAPDHLLSVQIGDIAHSCPLLWLDDLFHQQTIMHYNQRVAHSASQHPAAPTWPPLLASFYNFAFQVTVSLKDVQLQFNVVERGKVQTKKVCQYVFVHGSHVRDITVDLHFYKFLESIGLYQYLPYHPKNPRNTITSGSSNGTSNGHSEQPTTMDEEMRRICCELTKLITCSLTIEQGLKTLLLKYLEDADLCTFILAVVNSNTIPGQLEGDVVELLRRELNLPDITSLADLTGASLTDQPDVAACETVGEAAAVADINSTLATLIPGNTKLNETVKKFILNEPMKVIDMMTELQNSSSTPLTFEALSQMILARNSPHPSISAPHTVRAPMRTPSVQPTTVAPPRCAPATPRSVPTPPKANSSSSPEVQYVRYVTPPGYNPRYYSPHLSPQHQQRYGRPPLRRTPPAALGAIQHIPVPVIPAPAIPGPRPGPRPKDLKRSAPEMVSKGVQVQPAQRTVQQQVSLKPAAPSQTKRERFVDLTFCPHV